MHEINLRSVDLNLLTVFEAVYEEQSQVKAAERLGMTQPAISHALGRLRHLVGDRLFQGRSKGLTPTGQADDFYRRVHQALELIRAELAERSTFDPATSQRTFVVALDYGGGALLGVKLFQRISALAPHIRLVLRSIDPGEEIPGLLREHRVDLAFNASRFKDDVLEQPETWKTRLRVVVRKDHPRIKANPTMDELMAERMVVANVSTIRTDDPVFNKFLDRVCRQPAMEVPNAMLLPLVLESSDLITVTPALLAETMREHYGVEHYPVPAPLDSAVLHSYMIWHRSMTVEPAHCWLRDQFQAVMESLMEAGQVELSGYAG